MADLPIWQPLDRVSVPKSVGTGRLVAFVATEGAVSAGWAPTAALDVVRRWSRSGERVVIADAGLAAPSLHTAAGIPNREGLSDATLHGASVARVSRPLDDGGLFLVTAGAPVADPSVVVRSPRWYRLTNGFAEADVTLALYLLDGEPGTAAFLGAASDIIVLAAPSEPAPDSVRDIAPLVRAVTGFSSDVDAALVEAEPDADAPAPDGSSLAPGQAQRAAVGAGTTDIIEAGDEAAGDRRGPGVAPVVSDKGGMGRVIVMVVLAMVAAAVLGWFLTSGIG
jgi:hypothetical protein